ncbi:cytochrome c oxidase subunit 3 [Massilia litorea]|uniref:Cytochrome c oxidase subunit 3 n=1 Tax=Massilia litorea TaxID=2769491 RepID=A0A7L9U725_9BURK|nr:cytochrome c oxidase subunit 3 [Massilia litorea]QOL50052.1 cytochrome c oxidase subunit 3 [Massilia litorea]
MNKVDTNVTTHDIDVARLPTYVYGSHSMMWWGTMGLMLIEGTVFAITVVVYFYLRSHSQTWPVNRAPELFWGGLNTLIMLASLVPNQLAKRAAEREDKQRARWWLVACLLFALTFLVVRVFEFGALNTRWDSNAYGSVVWMLLALHTTHLVTDTIDTTVLAVLMFTGPLEGKRFVDVSENAMYWYFVVGSWLPIYAVIYWGARL